MGHYIGLETLAFLKAFKIMDTISAHNIFICRGDKLLVISNEVISVFGLDEN